MEGSSKKKKGPASSADSIPPAGREANDANIATSYFAKPSLDDMGPGTDTARPLFRKPELDEMGRDVADPAKKGLFRKNDLDEMTVGRTEKPVRGDLPEKPDAAKSTKRFSPLLEGQPERADDVRPLVRGKVGAGSYEDAGDAKRQKRTKGKTGRPGQ